MSAELSDDPPLAVADFAGATALTRVASASPAVTDLRWAEITGVVFLDADDSTLTGELTAVNAPDGTTAVVANWPASASSVWRSVAQGDGFSAWVQIV